MTTRDILVVVNEHAGGGQMADVFRRLEHPLHDLLGPFDLAFTDRTGHAIDIVRQALAAGGRKLVLAAGGDGTLNEVVNGFFDATTGERLSPATKLAVIAGGTGGDFRKTVRIGSPDATLAALRGGRTMKVDVGHLVARAPDGGELRRHFINIASFGLAGLVDRVIPEFKAWGGKLGYYGAMLKSLWSWKNPRVVVTLDGAPLPPQPILNVAVANGRDFGGGMMVAPDARLDSGHFEVTVIGDFGRLELLVLTRAIYAGEHVYHPKVKTRRALEVVAEPVAGPDGVVPEIYLDIDGEPLGMLPARFTIKPGAIELIVP
ncbi:MAG: diacylglycerol kinase family lipid kinase [Deltaproteobacteria bacterium]|nr:diacylglycerol kinase family lipid kinase [Deltaproteobacteria bacterium]